MELDARHYKVIEYLAQPKKGGLTMKQIAEEAGVTERTIYMWKKNPVFAKEFKKTIIQGTHDKLADVTAAMIKEVEVNGNAAMAKLIFQMNDMLPGSSESVADKLGSKPRQSDIEAMQKRIKEYKSKSNNVVSITN